MMMRFALAFFGFTFIAGVADAQSAREFRTLADQLSRIERDLRDLEREVYRRRSGEQAPADAFLDPDVDPSGSDPVDGRFLERLGGLEREVRTLTARVEESLFRVEQLERRMDAMAEDIAFALQDGTGAARPGVSASTPQRAERDRAAGGASTSAPAGPISAPTRLRNTAPSGDVGAVADRAAPSSGVGFQAAKTMLLQGDLVGARDAFTDFIAAQPDDPRTPEARYWLGEALFASGDYDAAARAFLESVRADAEGGRAPESYLKLGMALGAVGETQEACEVFADLPRRFPSASSGLLRRMEVARDEVGCAA